MSCLRYIAEFYGYNPPTANLELLSRFFEKYPTYVDKAFLVVKVRTFRYTANPCSYDLNLMPSRDKGGGSATEVGKVDLTYVILSTLVF